MRSLLKLIFSFILIVVVGVAAGIWYFTRNFDLNSYKYLIEEQAYKYTGRELKINGDAHLGISFIPTLVIDDITFANASWAEQPYMAKIKNLHIEIALLPLLQKELIIKDFTLVEPQIYLEKSASGMTNWDFTLPQKATASVQTMGFAQLEKMNTLQLATADSPDFLPDFLKEITIKNIGIDDGYLQYIDNTQKQELSIKTLDFDMESLNSPAQLTLDAVYQKEPVFLKLTLGSINDLLTKNKPVSIDAEAKAYKVDALVKGTVLNPLDNISYDIELAATSPKGNFDLPETEIQTALEGTPSKITANIHKLALANNIIKGSVIADISNKTPQLAAKLESPQIDLRTLQYKKSAASFNLIATAYATSLVPNTPVPYSLLRTVNGNFKVNIKKLIIDEAMMANNVALRATLQNGILNINPLNLDFGSGNIDLTGTLNANTKTLNLALNSKNILLQDLHKEFIVTGEGDFGIISGGNTTINAKLTSQGNTYRQLVENLNGQTIMLLDKSKIQTGHLQFMTNTFIQQLLSALNVNTKATAKTHLQCAVIRTDIANGKAVFPQGIAIQSNNFTLSSDGNINLINDKINFVLRPAFNLDTGIAQALTSLIKITGTLTDPKISLDDKQALKTLVGVATTGGIGYLGSQAATSDNSPCYTALKGTSFQSLVPQPSAASKAQQETIQSAKDVYNETKANVKQELKNIKQNAKDFINMFKGK